MHTIHWKPNRATRTLKSLLIAVALVSLTAIGTSAAIPKGSLHIDTQLIAGGLLSPVGLTHAGDGRLFVVDQPGQIRVISNGTLLSTPFLDLTSKVYPIGANYDERGLLGLTFHPDYQNNGKFYAYYSAPGAPTGWNHHSVLSEFTVSADPNVASTTERIIMTIDQPQGNHNGGHLAFGPDNFLYLATGDGGAANDVGTGHTPITGNAQDLTNNLGKVLRIDVNNMDPGLQYAVPPDNPYAGATPGVDEIYAHGFRNPFMFSFDRVTGELYVADVGQNFIEEIDLVVKGGNYGWKAKEGTTVFDAALPQTGYIDPIAEYTHEDGFAVIGGFVYRGAAIPALQGMYVFGDLSDDLVFQTPVGKGRLFYIDPNEPGAQKQIYEFRIGDGDVGLGQVFLKGIGEDVDGEIYLLVSGKLGPLGATSGQVLKVVPEPSSFVTLAAMGISMGAILRRRR